MRRFLTITLLAALCALSGASGAEQFPSKRVDIVVPFPPGGVTDMLARALATELAKLWNQPVVVVNLPGAGSIIGAEKVTHAAPDGHTLLLTIDPTVVNNRFVYKKLPYDPDKSLAPVTMIARGGLFMIANPSFPANSLRELVEVARAAPGKVAYASAGIGTQTHLILEKLGKREGVAFYHVPYKGGIAPNMTAVMANEVQLTMAAPAVAGSLLKAGRIKALAITGSQRSILFPEVPTFAESGFPDIRYVIWWGVFAPGRTSRELVERINRDVLEVVKRPDFVAKYVAAFDINLVADTPGEFAAEIRDGVQTIADMVKAANVEPQ